LTILETLTTLLIFLSVLFAIFLISVPSEKGLGNKILAAFLLIRAVDAGSIFFYQLGISPVIDQLRHDIGAFLQAPLLFLFVLSIIYTDFKLQRKHLFHLIPLALSLLVWTPNFYLPHLGIVSFPDNNHYYFEGRFTYILGALQTIAYIITTYFIIFRYKKIYAQNYSSPKPFNYQWLMTMNHIALGLFFIAFIKNIIKFADLDAYLFSMRVLTTLAMIFFISWLVLKALYAPKLFRGIQSSLVLIPQNKDEQKVEKQLSPDIETRIQNLKTYLKEQESYLKPDLTIAGLAKEMNMDKKELSQLINRHMGQNFYNLINDYRVQKASTIFSDNSQNHLTILEVLYRVGFNSKSSFNQAFKKSTGLTPTEYRKNQLNRSDI
jgi:AraC-like DNA-binding protein